MSGINDEIIDSYMEAFKTFDKSNKGYLKSSKLRHVLKHIGYNPTDVELEKLIIDADVDGNGEIDEEEFIDLALKLNPEVQSDNNARCAFNAFDFMGEGFINSHDLREALLYVMEKSTENEKDEIIRYFKLHKNRKLYYPEFKQMITMTRD